MRWVFISLLLLNAVVFIWHSVESSRQERIAALSTSSESDTGVVAGAPLVLVSELSEQERQALSKPKPVSQPPTAAPTVPAAEQQAAPEVTQTVVKPAEESAKPVDSKPPEAKPVESVLVKTAEPNQCLILGPVNIKQVEQLSQRLMAVTIISEPLDVDVKGAPEYWVVLPPFPDDKQALQKLQELQGRGLQAQIVPSGPLVNAISFGLRGQKEDADKLADDLKAKGNRVEVRAVPVTRKEKWLALSERQAPKLNDEIWQGIQKDFPKLEKRARNCH